MMQSLSQLLLMVGGSVELSIVVKATVAIAVGLLAARLARRACASTRHLILAFTFAGLLMLPFAMALVPDVAIEVPVSSATSTAASQPETRRSGSAVVPGGVVARPEVETTRWS